MRPDRLLGGHLLELAIGLSVLVHAGAARVLPRATPVTPAPSAYVEMVALPKPARIEPALPEAPPPPPPPAPKPVARVSPPPAAPIPRLEPAKPRELTGTTLTADGPGASFEAPSGDGSSRSEPMEAGPKAEPRPAPRLTPSPPPTRPPPPAPRPPARTEELARKPAPPALAAVLARHYPDDARKRGVGGQAVVRARVDPDGKVRTASVVSESEPGFGSACQRTLVGSTWSAPLGRDGSPVATWVRYTCRFRVGL